MDLNEGSRLRIPARLLKAAQVSCAERSARSIPALVGIHVQAEPGRVILSSTDSYQMSFIEAECGGIGCDAEFTVDAARIVEGICKRDKWVEFDLERRLASYLGRSPYLKYCSFSTIGGRFPSLRDVLPSYGSANAGFGGYVKPRYLRNMARFFKHACGSMPVGCFCEGWRKPVVFSCDSDGIRAVYAIAQVSGGQALYPESGTGEGDAQPCQNGDGAPDAG